MFFLRRSKIVVDAFINSQLVLDCFPIKPASAFLPNWWKELDSYYDRVTETGLTIKDSTIKRCDGFTSLYKHGFIIPLWCDVALKTHNDGSWVYESSSKLSLVSHPRKQLGKSFDDKIHIKFDSPWWVKEKTGIKFHYGPCQWNHINSDIIVPNGVVDYTVNNGTQINMLLPKQETSYLFTGGTPLAHMIPLTEKTVELRTHCLDEEEYNKLVDYNTRNISFIGHYKKLKIISKNKKQCPFGFGK